MRQRRWFYKHIVVGIISLLLALVLCTYTEGFLRPPVIMLFNALKGQGFVPSKTVKIELDEKGVPITIYPQLGPQRNPVNIAQQGLRYWDEGKLDLFLNIADWLVKNATFRDGFVVWEYKFPWQVYGMSPPWISGMAQGLGVEVLGRAYELTGEEHYLAIAQQALGAFMVDIPAGVRIKDPGGGWWYEEYADVGGKNPRVLNGMIFALQGIYDFWRRTGNEKAKIVFEHGILAVKNHSPEYDGLGWSYYDALGNLASESYHKIHIAQMQWLYKITGDEFFKSYYEDWKSDLTSPLRFFIQRLFLQRPTESDIVIIVVTFLVVFLVIEGMWQGVRRLSRK